ncbi:unnamed protein product [Orchesella dallaii]|uniref:Protein kinase domain-containing protein n=1 Tax=Orchesella dallaii TaxID=48710 RepID=A0ABP1QAP5_9HEXA
MKLFISSVCGYSVQGVVRAFSIFEIVKLPFLILMHWAYAFEPGKTRKEYDFFAQWGLPLTFGLAYPVVRILVSWLLFKVSKARNVRMLWVWVVLHTIIFIGILSSWPFMWSNNAIFGEMNSNSLGILIMKSSVVIYVIIWNVTELYLVFCLIKDIDSCGSFNATLSKLSDKEIDELNSWLNFNNLPNVKTGSFNISVKDLQIDEAKPLGVGSFGSVYKAVLLKDGENSIVAVKSVQNGRDANYFKALLEEFSVLAYLGTHSNVVKFVGTCTELLAQRKLYLVMEFCAFGSMDEFLKAKRSLFTSFVENGCWCGEPGYRYINIKPSQAINTLHLLQWTYDICKGMEFLEEKKVVHGDLAARNVLLDHKKVAKISDFGLSTKLYESTNVIRDDMKLIPWRWMAIESLIDLQFSSKSDSWSFACTIWEIFSLAEVPFAGCTWDSGFVDSLKSGELRLERPSQATHELYALMMKCWSIEPHLRPSFSRMSLQLGEMVLKYSTATVSN